ncbi:uncharacterized protein TNCV_2866641 [Trichonephila clavipes]|nr:uncharacterized protein TNCV_2866641 [Trichonephila clavipes]
MEAQLRSEESAPLIRGTENGSSDEASDQEEASVQLIPVRHKVSTELYVDRVGPLPVIPGHKHILSDDRVMPELSREYKKFDLSYLDNVVVFSEGWDFPIDHMDGILELNTHLAVRPAEFELAQDGVEYCCYVVGLGKQSPTQLKSKELLRMFRGSGGEGFPRIRFPYVPDRLVWKGHADDRFRGSRLKAEGKNALCIGSVTGDRYYEEVLLPHVHLFRGAIGPDFIFMDDNARAHRTLAVEELLESEDITRMD